MSSCVRKYSTALSHSLLMLTSIASAKPTEILRPTLGCLKHTCRDEDASNQQDMGIALMPKATMLPSHMLKMMHHIHASTCIIMCRVFMSGM